MGLTIHYKFGIKCSKDDLITKLNVIRDAITAGNVVKVDEVSPLWETTKFSYNDKDFCKSTCPADPEWFRRWLIQTEDLEKDSVKYNVWHSIMPDNEAIGFSVGIMEGCKPFSVPLKNSKKEPNTWKGHSFTKTQYALNFHVAHNTACTLINMMKLAGFTVEVDDEGDYYQTRDLNALSEAYQQYDSMIKMFGQILGDDARD